MYYVRYEETTTSSYAKKSGSLLTIKVERYSGPFRSYSDAVEWVGDWGVDNLTILELGD